MRARTLEVALGEAGAAGGAGFGATGTLGARDLPRPGAAGGEAGTAAREDERGDGRGADSGGPGGAAQAELSRTTKVSAPNRPRFKAHHLFVIGTQPCCKDQGRGNAPRPGAATSRWHRTGPDPRPSNPPSRVGFPRAAEQ